MKIVVERGTTRRATTTRRSCACARGSATPTSARRTTTSPKTPSSRTCGRHTTPPSSRKAPPSEWCLALRVERRPSLGVHIGGSGALVHARTCLFRPCVLRALRRDPRGGIRPTRARRTSCGKSLFIDHVGRAATWRSGAYDHGHDLRVRLARRTAASSTPLFLENVDSHDLRQHLPRARLHASPEIRDVYPLKKGLTNLSCHFSHATAARTCTVTPAWAPTR